MELQGRNALVFGAGGEVGAQVARVFAREGARMWLSGPRTESVERTADAIRDAGGAIRVWTTGVGTPDSERIVTAASPMPMLVSSFSRS